MSKPRDLQHEFYDMLMESQYWLPETMLTYQRSQLAQLLRHARTNVPFYENRLDPVFTATGDIDWDRWHEIPIVTRTDMLEHRDAMLAREIPKGHGASSTISSSGSTGLPIQITSNRLTVLAANANRWRAHRWHGLDWSKTYTARDGHAAEAAWPHGQLLGRWGPSWDENAQTGKAIRLNREATASNMLEFINRSGSSYFSSGAKTLHAMALEAERLEIEARIDCFLIHGEHVGDEDRAALQRVFGARTLEHYSSKEGGQMAYACPDGHGFHVSAESVLVEIVDAEGRPCAVGDPGRVVITPFVSTSQPLIRYDQGDIARFGLPCSCGRGLPLIEAIEGRATAMFTHPDGRTISRFFPPEARQALGASYWQVAQVGPLSFEVRYVPIDWQQLPDLATAAAVFGQVYFADAEVRFLRMNEIPLTAAGKHLEYVNEWAAGTRLR
jgi:phenylacetate-CoA ligase